MKVVALENGAVIGVANRDLELGVSVIALHGWGRDRKDFQDLDAKHDYLAIDLPGFGASPPPPSPWGAREYAHFLAETIRPVIDPNKPVVLVGHSFGGRIALCMAANYPDLVRGLVLIGVPLLSKERTGPSLRLRLSRAANRIGIYSDKRIERLRFRKGSPDYRSASGVMRNVLVRVVNESYEIELSKISCDISFLWGEDDTAVPVKEARTAASLVRNLIEFKIVPGAKHDVHLTNQENLNELIDTMTKCASP